MDNGFRKVTLRDTTRAWGKVFWSIFAALNVTAAMLCGVRMKFNDEESQG